MLDEYTLDPLPGFAGDQDWRPGAVAERLVSAVERLKTRNTEARRALRDRKARLEKRQALLRR